MNLQPIEKFFDSKDELQVHSIFYTIQGEGPFCGYPAVFVRLAGCNLQCPGCDTDYTSKRTVMTSGEVALKVSALMPFVGGLVVITGGEPFRQNLSKLFQRLVYDLGCAVQVETNGTLPPTENMPSSVVVVCSPKAGKISSNLAAKVSCYKYVLSATSIAADGLPGLVLGHSASPHVARPPEGFSGKIYIQPMDAQDEAQNKLNVKAAVASAMEHGYIMQLQVHKILNLE